MKTLMSISLLLIGMFTTVSSTSPVEGNAITETTTECARMANCCATITVPQTVCSGIPHPISFVTFRRAGSPTSITLSQGTTYLEIDANTNYEISFQGAPNTSCFDILVSWTLCGRSGSSVIPFGGTATIRSGKFPSQANCFGF